MAKKNNSSKKKQISSRELNAFRRVLFEARQNTSEE